MKNMRHLPFLLTIPAVLPVAAVACSSLESPPALSSLCLAYSTFSKAGDASSNLDVFVYDAAEPYLLDSYQHFDSTPSQTDIASTSGEKILAAISGAHGMTYSDFRSWEDIQNQLCRLSDEDPSEPTMSGTCTYTAKGGSRALIRLSPCLCRIRLEKVTVDLSERPYKDAVMALKRAYLINVSGLCPIIEGKDSTISEIINYGRFDPECTGRMAHPEMLYSESVQNAVFHCFPGYEKASLLGSCPTRLVVETEMDSVTYYYPITIPDMKRGREYIYNLTITRSGCLDPDIPADPMGIKVELRSRGWSEFEDETIDY